MALVMGTVLIGAGQAQSAWKYKNSESTAKKLLKNSDLVTQTHAVFEKDIRISYQWDAANDKPIVVEEGLVSVVALIGGVSHSHTFFQTDNSKIERVEGVYKSGKTYSLPMYTRTYEDESIFSQDGEYMSIVLGRSALFGEVAQYKYVKVYEDIKFFTNTFFQDAEYVQNGKVEIWIPKWCQAEVLEYNLKGSGIKKKKDRKVEWASKKEDPFGSLEKETTYTVYRYEYDELPSYQSEAESPGASHYMPHVLHLNKSYKHNSDFGTLIEKPGDLYKWYKSLVDELEEEPSEEVKQLADSLARGLTNDDDKIRSVFYWVQDHVRYIAFEDGIAGFKPEEAGNVCSYRYGDCKGMANLTKSMLVHLGFDARLTWIGTRRIAYTYEQPTLAADNHMICTVVKKDGSKLFLDPTEDYVSLDYNAYRIQGQQVMIENGDSFLLEVIPEMEAEENRVTIRKQVSLKGSTLSGSESRTYIGESKKNILIGYSMLRNQHKSDALKRYLSGNNGNLALSKVKTGDLESREGLLEMSFDFELSNNLIDLGGRKLVQLDWDQELYFMNLDKSRVAPYALRQKLCRSTEVRFLVPAGYQVAEMPEALLVEKEGYTFKINYRQEGNAVVMQKELLISDTMIEPKQFKEWNEDIAQLRAAYDRYLVIEKI